MSVSKIREGLSVTAWTIGLPVVGTGSGYCRCTKYLQSLEHKRDPLPYSVVFVFIERGARFHGIGRIECRVKRYNKCEH